MRVVANDLDSMRKFINHREDGCWIWSRTNASGEEPRICYRGTWMLPRRCVWLATGHEILPYHQVASNCGTTDCVNPDHAIVRASPSKRKQIAVKDRGAEVESEEEKNLYRLATQKGWT